MFSVYLVFARPIVRLHEGQSGMMRGEEFFLTDSFFPKCSSSLKLDPGAVDERLRAEGFPKASMIGEFCFPKKRTADDIFGLVPPSLPFCFTLTLQSGERVHGYCLRSYRPLLDGSSHRIDVGCDFMEASVLLTKFAFPRLFPLALQICRVRRYMDPPSCWDFLEQLYASVDTNKRVVVESPTLQIACRYEFSTVAIFPKQLEILFETTTSQMMHFILGSMLLERRLLFVGRTEQKLSETMYALDSLLVQVNAPVLLGYPHNFTPVLPFSLLEQGLGNPTCYMVGLLKIHLKGMDSLKDLGDIVIVDLDQKQIRLSPGSATLVSLGMDIGKTQQQVQQQQQQEELWGDVTTPFYRDVLTSYQQRDADLLSSAVRAMLLLLTLGGKQQGCLEDANIRAFHNQFKTTSIFAVQQAGLLNNPSLSGLLQMSRGYVQLRMNFNQQIINALGAERQAAQLAKQTVLELPPFVGATRTLAEIAKRSFDTYLHQEGTLEGIKQKYADSTGRNWKNGYKVLGLVHFLVKAGSELCVSQVWDDCRNVFEFTRFSLQGAVGVPSKVTELVQRRAWELYLLAVDLHVLKFTRSMAGHVLVQRTIRQRMQNPVKRLVPPSNRGDLEALLDLCAPVLPTTDVEASMERLPVQAPPPPPPPPPLVEEVLLDFESFTVSQSPSPTQPGLMLVQPILPPRNFPDVSPKHASPPGITLNNGGPPPGISRHGSSTSSAPSDSRARRPHTLSEDARPPSRPAPLLPPGVKPTPQRAAPPPPPPPPSYF